METAILFLTGLLGLISTLLKLAIDIRNKKESPDGKYEIDIQKFDKALATGDPDAIGLAFEQLRREAEKRDRDTGRQNSETAK